MIGDWKVNPYSARDLKNLGKQECWNLQAEIKLQKSQETKS